MARIVVLGSNFAGMTAAIELKRSLGKDHEVSVISPAENFLYVPSLIWVPFGRRRVSDITFPLKPQLDRRKIGFIHDAATSVDPKSNTVHTKNSGDIEYDYLVISTGVGLKWDIVPNADPDDGYIDCIVTPRYAEKAYESFKKLVADPGPVVVGATQGASCMGAGYEYLFNLEKELRRNEVRDKVQLTWITPEPVLGDFGIGGVKGGEWMLKKFMSMFEIDYKVSASIEKIEKEAITLADGTVLPYKMAMLIPPFVGADVMLNSPELVDDKGFVPVTDAYRHETYENVYAAGLSVTVKAPKTSSCASVPYGVPKTGYPTDTMAKVAARNIAHAIKGTGKVINKPFGKMPGICVMDAGYKEVYILTNDLFKPRKFELMLPNPVSDWGKILLEKYMLWKNRKGYAHLP